MEATHLKEPAPYRDHVKTWAWRMEQDLLLKDREEKVEAREADAGAILMVAKAIAAGDVDPEATADAFATGRADRTETVEDAPRISVASDDGDEISEECPEADKVVPRAGATPETLAELRSAVTQAPKAAGCVFMAFGAAWKRLRCEAEERAEVGLRGACDEVRAADNTTRSAPRTRRSPGSLLRSRPRIARGSPPPAEASAPGTGS